ncbi:hypothetical protein COO60DRAFT_893179 [Scenedesmus sp. NREL 46B-D3]|nr:hypothetical protein COO60DRAFT_893179 [Scenedesmus sp. NREL 46B-D3]
MKRCCGFGLHQLAWRGCLRHRGHAEQRLPLHVIGRVSNGSWAPGKCKTAYLKQCWTRRAPPKFSWCSEWAAMQLPAMVLTAWMSFIIMVRLLQHINKQSFRLVTSAGSKSKVHVGRCHAGVAMHALSIEVQSGLGVLAIEQRASALEQKATGRFPAKKWKIDKLGGCPMSLSLAQ